MLCLFDIHQPDVGVMHQRCRLKSLAWLLVGQPRGGKLPQLLVDKRQQLLGSGGIALFNLRQDLRNVRHAVDYSRPLTAISLLPTVPIRTAVDKEVCLLSG